VRTLMAGQSRYSSSTIAAFKLLAELKHVEMVENGAQFREPASSRK
jgi:hypothetical protein